MKPLIYQYRMQWRELLQCVGVVPDNISSMVHAFGIRLKKQEIWHPAYEAFCRCGEPYVLTMENLKGSLTFEHKYLSIQLYFISRSAFLDFASLHLGRAVAL